MPNSVGILVIVKIEVVDQVSDQLKSATWLLQTSGEYLGVEAITQKTVIMQVS